MVEVRQKGVVAVTRNGLGDWWLFDTYENADTHPLIQYGDVICTDPDKIVVKWTRIEIPLLLEQLVSPVERATILVEFRTAGWGNWKRTMDRFKDILWQRMIEKAKQPPADPATICNLITRDRKLSLKERKTMAKETTKPVEETTEAAAETGAATEAPAEKGTTKRAPPAREPKFKPEMIITMLADKDGKPFSAENNPKRAGSQSAERFALYVNGMSVDQAVAAGLTRGDLANDVDKKFISIA